MTSPTARSLAFCRSQGLTACVVEKWNPHARIRQDAFGFIDILVLDGSIIGVQATSDTNHAARRTKIAGLPAATAWREAGGIVEVWSWRKAGARGKRKTWQLRRERL